MAFVIDVGITFVAIYSASALIAHNLISFTVGLLTSFWQFPSSPSVNRRTEALRCTQP